MAAINDIRGRIDMLQITITKIYTATCSPVETAKNHIGIPNLPLLSMKEWNKWENFLSEEENKLLMVRKYFVCPLLYFKKHLLQCIIFLFTILLCIIGWIVSRAWQR